MRWMHATFSRIHDEEQPLFALIRKLEHARHCDPMIADGDGTAQAHIDDTADALRSHGPPRWRQTRLYAVTRGSSIFLHLRLASRFHVTI